MRHLWKAGIPLEVKIFLWQLFRRCLPTSNNIAKHNGPSDGNCVVCSVLEDTNHTFFRCPLALFAWSAMREASGLDWDPASSAELVALLNSLRAGPKCVM